MRLAGLIKKAQSSSASQVMIVNTSYYIIIKIN